MSKCREAFDMAVIEHLGPAALCGGKMSIYEAAEIMWQAAWNARGKVDAEICREQVVTPMLADPAANAEMAIEHCAEAIEKENCND